MPYQEELKVAVIIVAVVMAYKLLLQPKLRAAKQRLLERFLYAQSFSLNMQDLLLKHVLKHDAINNQLMSGVTFKSYLRDLQKKHAAYLSDKYYKKLKRQNVVFFYLKINRMLNHQEERLQRVKQDLSRLEVAPVKTEARVNY